jgi:DNA-binding NarL/FixJ family response regulator
MQTPVAAEPRACAAPPAAPIRVFLADDHAVTLWGLEQLVNSMQPRMQVVGTAASCADLLAHPAIGDTDVLLLDLGLRDRNAIECVQRLVDNAGVKVVLLTGDLNPAHHREAVLRGARGVVLKSQPTEHILKAIEQVHAGEAWLDRGLMSSLLGDLTGPQSRRPRRSDDAAGRIESLTPKEREVVQAVVAHRGAKSLVVAEVLGMSENTLRNHLSVIYSKLQVKGKLDLYAFAIEHGLASPPSAATGPSTAVGSGTAWPSSV